MLANLDCYVDTHKYSVCILYQSYNYYSISLEKLTLLSGSFSAPPDVTLKLPDGITFKAHKVILAAVSPVFNGMLYGKFEEGKSDEVNLQEENGSMMKLFIDFIYNGNCQIENLDDMLPLMKIVDYYQVNKAPFCVMCGKVILDKLDSTNYLSLLPKFASVMSKESIQKAADLVMCCNSDFASKFDDTKDFPEELLLCLLQRNDIPNPEMDIFNFLVKWHEYQTKELNKTLTLVTKLFNCIRYSLINPQLLLSKIADCSYVSKELLIKALDCLYSEPLGLAYNCRCARDECHTQKINFAFNRPRLLNNITWNGSYGTGTTTTYDRSQDTYNFQYSTTYNSNHVVQIAYSSSLKNGVYWFKISGNISLAVCENDLQLYSIPKVDGLKVILLVYKNNIFVKTIKDNKVNASYNITGSSPSFSLSIMTHFQAINFQIMHNI